MILLNIELPRDTGVDADRVARTEADHFGSAFMALACRWRSRPQHQ